MLPTQTLRETDAITFQSNQILGSSDEVNVMYQQMRRTLAYAIIRALASNEASTQISAAFPASNPI